MAQKKISAKQYEKLTAYLLKNPPLLGTRGCYGPAACKFHVSPEYVRRVYRTIRENSEVGLSKVPQSKNKVADRTFKENVKAGEADVTVITAKRIKTLADLIEACEIDLETWEILSWECNKWEVGRKDKQVNWESTKGKGTGVIKDSGRIFVEPLFQVKAKLGKRKVSTDLNKQKELILKEIINASPVKRFKKIPTNSYGNLLEIALPDVHLGKLAWREETDEDYDIKIAEERFKTAVDSLLSRVDLTNVSRILFPVGNDLFNVDNRQNTTFAGTPQDTDCRYIKVVKNVRRLLVEVINDLAEIAPVDVVIIPGNHDTNTTFLLGEILEAYYHNNVNVNVDNTPKLRKYYRWGDTAIQFTHGDQEKHAELGLIFATEQAKLWYESKYRFAQLGHFHKNKKISYVSVDEFSGFQVQILPSLSGTDFWHKSKGYLSNKAGKAFLFGITGGLLGEFTYTL